MLFNLIIVIFLVIFFHFMIKNYLLKNKIHTYKDEPRIEYSENVEKEESIPILSEESNPVPILSETKPTSLIMSEIIQETPGILKKNGKFTGEKTNINNIIDENLENKLAVQFDNNSNKIQNENNNQVKNDLLQYINSTVYDKNKHNSDIYKGYDEIKSKNIVFNNDNKQVDNDLNIYFENVNNKTHFNEIEDSKDSSNSTFCPPTDKSTIKNTPLSDTACLQGIDQNSNWRGRNVPLNCTVNEENVLNGGRMEGGLLAYDMEDGLYSEY